VAEKSRSKFGDLVSEGQRQLWVAKGSRRVSQFSRDLGVPVPVLVKWLYGERRPGATYAPQLEVAGISLADFARPPRGRFPGEVEAMRSAG
jgi:hypothetical protein